jgi:hypothetical protein
MAETYSLAATARHVSYRPVAQTIKVPDTAARPAHIAYHSRLGNQVLCQNADGSQSYYVFDAERSTPSDIVMRKV